ncbi:SGNH/GDSL hydrolase family protein [Enterococcus asini]|uniref:SGNH/GDSL hydrolase family protein n=1 Tax=Enterococcus asini TaxID=57732 RepID=UPI00288E86A2|nr:SGNH/GDSL hydrolase family protein [Enterococcus asini]MDT2757076.1 SGNH/GDSL hydrolase family protein [Enterococcus asini]
MKKIVVIGDSIAVGMYQGSVSSILDDFIVDELAGMGFPGYEVVNLGRPKEGSPEVAARIEEAVAVDADFVVINVGINDALNRPEQVAAYKENMASMVGKFAPEKVIIMGLGVVDRDKKPAADPAVLQLFNENLKALAVETGAKFIDMYHHEMVYPAPLEFISEDGLHPSKFGYHLYGGLIARDIKNKLIG